MESTNYMIYKALDKSRERINKMIIRVYTEEHCYNHHSFFQLLKNRTITVDKPLNIIFIIDISEKQSPMIQHFHGFYLLFHNLLAKMTIPSQIQMYLISDMIIDHHVLNFNKISDPEPLPLFELVPDNFDKQSLLDCFEHILSQQFQFGNRILFVNTPLCSEEEELQP